MKTDTSLSVEQAIGQGYLFVNLPVFSCIAIPLLISLILPEKWDTNSFIGFAIIPSILLAWVWWSWALPKWRLWAVKRVDDIELLFNKAIQAQLMWPAGHFFQKTEINSAKQKDELRRIMIEKMDTSDEYVVQIISKITT